MGKRELLLLVVFVVLGVGVYQVNAPAAPAEGQGFSLSRLFQAAKAHLQGNRARREVTRTATLAAPADLERITMADVRGTVVVTGSDRSDIAVTLTATLAGLDETDLAAQEQELRLSLEASDTQATLAVGLPERGRTRFEVKVEMPRRLGVALGGRGSAEVTHAASLTFDDFRGEVLAEAIAGPITGSLEEPQAEFGPGARLDLTTERGRLRAESPASVTLKSERTAVDIVDPTGPVTIDQEFARMDIRGTGGPVTITGEGGVVVLRQVTHPLSIKADRLTVTADLDEAVATTVEVEDDQVELTLPRSGGVRLEASVTDGELRVPSELTPTRTEREQTVTADLAGGGPLVKAVVRRGSLRIRARVNAGT